MPVKEKNSIKLNKEKVEKKVGKKIKNENALDLLKDKSSDEYIDISEDMLIDENYTLKDAYDAIDSVYDLDFYDVDYDRDVFMELRKIIDTAFAKRNKSPEDEKEYDDLVFNLTTKCVEDKYLQDFMGYCYKKGKYDFCLMNFDKYMKWTILAGSHGNAFSLSKLQLFLSNQVNELAGMQNIEEIMDSFELEPEQFYMVLVKKLCDQLVVVMDISPEKLIKEPEMLLEQSEQLMRKLDKDKQLAFENVAKECKQVIESIARFDEEIEKSRRAQKEFESLINDEQTIEKPAEKPLLTETEIEQEATKQMDSSNKFTKKEVSKKKFRW